MVLEAFWKGDREELGHLANHEVRAAFERRDRRARGRRPHARQPPGRDRAGGDRGCAARRQGRRDRGPLRRLRRRGDPRQGGRAARRLDERRGADQRHLDLPARTWPARTPTGCSSRPTKPRPDPARRAAPACCSGWPAAFRAATRIRPRRLPPPPPATALEAGVRRGPVAAPRLDAAAGRARLARASEICLPVAGHAATGCERADPARGLARACAPPRPARSSPASSASRFETVEVGDGAAFATGYYEPEIAAAGRRSRAARCRSIASRPICSRPIRRPASGAGAASTRAGNYVPYHDRAAIEDGALAGRGLELAWAADPVDLFFLQIQGSGRLLLPDGSVMRIGYAGQNGRDYVAIGRLLRERGIVAAADRACSAIRDWIARQSRGGAGADARESELRLLPGADRAGAARRARPAGDAARHRRRRSAVRAARRAGAARRHGQSAGERPVGRPGYGRRDPRARTGSTPSGARARRRRAIAGAMASRGRALLLLPRGTLRRLRADAPAQR